MKPVRSAVAPSLVAGLAGTALRMRLGAAAQRLAGAAVPWHRPLRASGLALTIRPLLRGNPDLAGQLYRGRFAFSGVAPDCGARGVFDIVPPTPAWAAELHGFRWLAHLEAAGGELARAQARALVTDWIPAARRHRRIAWRIDIAARRLIVWVEAAPFLLHNASAGFAAGFLAALARQTRFLLHRAPEHERTPVGLDAAIAVAYAATALAGFEDLRTTSLERLAEELDRQILADGGHVSRNPAMLVHLLVRLIPLRTALEEARIEVPRRLAAAIERMTPMLRFFLHGDGGLAAFNGVDDALAGEARAIVEADQVCGRPLSYAPHSGYCRLSHGRATVIVDTGTPPERAFAGRAHAGALAFELSEGPHRIVVNCGSSRDPGSEWAAATRTTSAHSTSELAGRSSSTILDGRLVRRLCGAPLLLGPGHVSGAIAALDQGTVLEARHDGFASALGYVYERRLLLGSEGTELRGEERFLPDPLGAPADPETEFTIRFHLHPSIKAQLSQDGASVVLQLPNRGGWRFSAKGARMGLEESIHLLGRGGPRRSAQILLKGAAGRAGTVHWAFRKIERRADAREANAPELPL